MFDITFTVTVMGKNIYLSTVLICW